MNNLVVSSEYFDYTNSPYATINGNTGNIFSTGSMKLYNNRIKIGEDSSSSVYGGIVIQNSGLQNVIKLDGVDGNITCVSLTQTSREKDKKDFEKLNNALEEIKNIDIYKYHLKAEEKEDKKHLGFVIGDKYNYSQLVTSKDNDGVDVYSFVSLCCKAIKEQQEEIEDLKTRIEKLERK